MLQARYADEPQLSERLGRHLLAAQAYDDALAPLYEGAMRCGNAAELDRSLTLLDLRREAIDRIEAPSQAARASAENKALRGLTKAVMGKRELATTFARAALEEAEALDDPCLIATCCYRLAQTYLFLNDFDACLPLLARGRDLVEEHDCERRLLMDLEGVTGQALARLGRADEAIEHLYRARDIADTIGRTLKLDNILWALGSCERHRGNLAEAETLLEDAIARAEQLGHQMTVARALVSLGDVVRLQGRLDDAAELYRRVLDYGHSERQHETLIGRLNLALVAIQTGDFDEAAPILDRLEELYEERNNRTMLLYVAVMKLACLADRGAWTELDAHVDHVQRELDDTQLVDADVAICLDAAARLCSTANQPHHARRLYEAAAHQWEAAGAHEKAHATRKKLPQ
jgi:tetratricopeptide (TPR) repeat protein